MGGRQNAERRLQSAEWPALRNFSGAGRLPKWMGAPPFNLRSAIGDWRLAILTLGAGSTRAATNAPIDLNEIPPLRPPKPEILPGFWEEHGLLVSVTGLVVVLVVILLWRILARPKPPLIPAPAAVARQALEPLRGRGEDATLLTEISLILRRYFAAAFQLPGTEFTNRELVQQLAGDPRVKPTLSGAASELLEGMEHRRFGTQPSPSGMHSVDLALDLIEQTETCLQPPPAEPGSATA